MQSLPPSSARRIAVGTRSVVVISLCLFAAITLLVFSPISRVKAVRPIGSGELAGSGKRNNAPLVSTSIVISQVYGGGGNGGSTFKNDFIELFNRGASPVNVAGWSVQYTSSAATSAWQVTNLVAATIQPGQYYLVQEAPGAGGTTNLPTPDASGAIAMSATTANVALVNSTTALATGCPAAAAVVDLVGYGSSACHETTSVATLANTTAALRNTNGCTDSDNNSSDFTVGAPNPRNTASLLNPCGGAGSPSITNSSPLPNGVVNSPYSVTFTATGGTGTGYSFTQTAGTLPPGLTLSGAVLSGTPTTTTGSPFTFTIQVTDSGSATGSKVFQLTVLPPATCAASGPPPQSCGVERWSVKTGTDADAGSVNLNSATPTTIANLHTLPVPDPTPPNNRVAPGETTQWVIQGTLVEYKLETDSDYHVVVQDGAGNTMVTEIPYPGTSPVCVTAASPFFTGIAAARCKFDSSSLPQATTNFQFANVPVRVTGVGMFDFPHGQTGASPNQIEIHPILDIAFPTTINTTTNPGSNVNVQVGDASVTFSTVTGGGTTTATPIDPSTAGTPPVGNTLIGPAFDISTTATVTAPINVCISVPYITDAAAFDKLKILHLEGGTLVDHTTGKDSAQKIVCGSLPSLSPVVVALGNSPTAADSTLTGKVVNTNGDPVAGVTVTLAGAGSARAITDHNGLYSFVNLQTGGFYSVTPELANHSFTPATRAMSLLGSRTDALFTAAETAPTANPLDTVEYFVRQQYVDLLGREPDQGGLDYWSAQIRSCGADNDCVRARRIGVSAAFFIAQEFQDTGFFLYRVYKASLGKAPNYREYTSDHIALRGGPNLEANKLIFADNFTARSEFKQVYPDALSNYDYVNKLFDSAGILFLPFERSRLVDALNAGATRGWVLDQVADETVFKQSQYNPAFVLTQYFGYLQRDPDRAGYDFWLNVLNARDSGNYLGMVCSFVTSTEYQMRFSGIVTHSNAECSGVSGNSSLGNEFLARRKVALLPTDDEDEDEEVSEPFVTAR
jgi:Lamin Tail Domain/Putative Ig domain/Carboxypeptidase regulatory-like domain/Domain of unknown function (DUF4214)